MRRLGFFLSLLVGLALVAAPLLAQQPPPTDSLCLAGIRISNGAVQRIACVKIPRDTLLKTDTLRRVDTLPPLPPRVDTLRLPGRIDTLWLPRPDTTRPDTTRADSLPPDSLPTPPDSSSVPDTTRVPPPSSGIAALPRAVPSTPAGLDTMPCTQVVTSGGLQLAINQARGGSVLCLTGLHRANFTVPARTDPGWVVIRSLVAWPASRIRPTLFAGATLETPNTLPAISFASRSVRTLVLGLEIRADSTKDYASGYVNALVQIGNGETKVSDLPDEIALDRLWIHGTPTQHVRRAVIANGASYILARSWCEEIHAKGFDSQCSISWNASGPQLIEDNTLEAASENLMWGGADPRVPGLVASDVTVRRNHIRKPPSWIGGGWNVKNLIETKSSSRVLVEENVLEGSWTDGQTGYAFVLKSTAQNSNCLQCGTSDWTIRRNLIDSVGAGFSIAGRADQRPSLLPPTGITDSSNRRFDIAENYFGPIGVGRYKGDARPVILLSDNRDLAIRGNTFEESPAIREALLFEISSGRMAVTNLTFENNALPRGQYGVGASAIGEGLKAWNAGALGRSTWSNNALVGKSSVQYPQGTSWHASLSGALAGAGVSRATINAGVAGVVIKR